MSLIKYLVLAALCLGALAIDARTAEASLYNTTQTWCKARGTADQVIVEDGFASLLFRPDGDLVLQPTNRLIQKIWSSGTAGTGDKVCWEATGTLAVYDAAGTKLWSKSGGTVQDPGYGTYKYQLFPSLSSCDLSARYNMQKEISSTFGLYTYYSSGKIWTRAAACPVVSQGLVGDDWCLDPPAAGKERPIVQTSQSELVWMPDGSLVQRARGIRAGQAIWRTPTAGFGRQLCFAPTGQLAIYDAIHNPLWSTPADTSTTSSHLLGLDDCDLDIKRYEGSVQVWASSHRCPQTTLPKNTQVTAGTSDVVLLENRQARLMFQADGNLVLRSAAGEEVWHSGLVAYRGKRVAFQNDGNLVVYDAANNPAWGAKMWDNTVTDMVLDGCAVSLLAGTTIKWTRGAPTCPGGAVTNMPAWSLPTSGVLTILRTPESRLVWQGDGNLVLYTASGAPVWASNTDGRGKLLSFQGDGNLVIYKVASAPTSADAVWSSDTWYTGGASHALRLGDHCTLTITDAGSTTAKWTGNNSCTVVNYTYERGEGDSMFGAALRTHLTAKDDGTARLDSTTSIDLTILGARIELLSASGYQTETDDGADLDTASVTIFGESEPHLNVTYEQTFFEKSRTFNVGPVPVTITVGASGELGLSVAFSGGALTITPSAGIYATVSAGIGGDCDLGGASAGVRGQLNLIDLGLPISLRLYLDNGQPKYVIKGDLTISTLSGVLELYAEAYVKVCFVKISADWSYELFSWTGLEWTKNLFNKTGSF